MSEVQISRGGRNKKPVLTHEDIEMRKQVKDNLKNIEDAVVQLYHDSREQSREILKK